MLRLTICLLVAKTAFAVLAFPVENGAYGTVGPDTNLVFNFEQIRRDQPPQIEMREENIHKYMNRQRTTPPTPIDNGDMSPMRPEHPIPYTEEQWTALQTAPKYTGPVADWKSVPAPPSFPHWDSLAPRSNNYNYESQPIVVTEETGQWYEPEIHSRAVPSYISSTAAPVSYAPMVKEPVHLSPRRNPSSGRGNHKFNWNDVSTTVPTTLPSVNTPTAALGRMPPPAVPTLSPWYDGF